MSNDTKYNNFSNSEKIKNLNKKCLCLKKKSVAVKADVRERAKLNYRQTNIEKMNEE